ncbi:hypothetical protein BCR42DRAFT_61544 [Absidia repens]|uniref:BRCT domain-containing protein n=1 Tax=Absidia repens TaxID=90262 RepID=A0A1X2ID72_9FUNG|nr:hypothetical protein BCR42DRAFT_61544 [Absidia repens]
MTILNIRLVEKDQANETLYPLLLVRIRPTPLLAYHYDDCAQILIFLQLLLLTRLHNTTSCFLHRLIFTRSIEAMGATVVFNWDLCTHLVTDSVKKTTNLLCALASKRYIVSERWAEMSILKAHFEDEKDYVVIRQSGLNYFTNKKLYFQPSADIKRSDAQDLAKAVGAKLRGKQPDMVKCDRALIVVSSGTLKETRPYEKAGYETMKRDDFLKLYGQSDD